MLKLSIHLLASWLGGFAIHQKTLEIPQLKALVPRTNQCNWTSQTVVVRVHDRVNRRLAVVDVLHIPLDRLSPPTILGHVGQRRLAKHAVLCQNCSWWLIKMFQQNNKTDITPLNPHHVHLGTAQNLPSSNPTLEKTKNHTPQIRKQANTSLSYT